MTYIAPFKIKKTKFQDTILNSPKIYLFFLIALIIPQTTACAHAYKPGSRIEGLAAWYNDSLHGRKTASGEIYNKNKLTAAHRTLPFGTKVKVTNKKNMRSVVLKINDRGPFGNKKRIIDISRAGATKLDMIRDGVVEVYIDILSMPNH